MAYVETRRATQGSEGKVWGRLVTHAGRTWRAVLGGDSGEGWKSKREGGGGRYREATIVAVFTRQQTREDLVSAQFPP